ncbi:MAG TPA: riboflavin synthase [Bryobacteraceae bacterium]|nr:riboflavin synthase [Bryobacteraceae bacterium]
MFTGIIEEVGVVESYEPRGAGGRLRVRCPKVAANLAAGASVSVNGACLTEVEPSPGMFTADVAQETLRRTNLGDLRAKSLVNLERALSPSGRLDGHIVQGHVDGTGELIALKSVGEGNWWLTVRAPRELEPYLVSKGSVALDGMSLTVAALEGDAMSITVIPHTYQNTNLRARRPGDRLNIECDILAKYVEKLLGRRSQSGLTLDKLEKLGY